MNNCNIGNDGAIAIAEGYVRNNSITHLLLRDNNISDNAGAEIIKGLRFERKVPLEVLNLANNLLKKKSGEALITLLPLLKNPPSQLHLENNLLETHKYELLHIFAQK